MRITVIAAIIINMVCWTLATLFMVGVLFAPIVAVAYMIGG